MDQLLVEKARQGDSVAFEKIYHKHRDYMLTIAINLTGHGGWAEDIVQDVFTGFIDSLRTFKLKSSLKSYFAVCVSNKARDFLRKCKVRKSNSLDDALGMKSSSKGPVNMAIQDEDLCQLRQGFSTLPFDQQEVITLHVHGGMTFKDIANALDIPLTTANSRYRYGLDKLRTFMKEVDNA